MTLGQCQSIAPLRPKPTKVLVLGSTGMVGRSWIEHLKKLQIRCEGVSRPEFDLMRKESIVRCVGQGYDLVINAAAWTDVDGAESDEPGAHRANAEALNEIGSRCYELDIPLISYSTDYVFSGCSDVPYPVDASIEPINAYGRSKALGEAHLARSDVDHIMIRTSWVYAPWGTNFVRTIQSLAQSRSNLRVVNDQRGRPTSAQQLAKGSLDLYLNGARGTWHLSDEGECTWFELAREIVRISELDCKVEPCSSDEYLKPAARPAYSVLDIQETVNLIGPIGDWRLHVQDALEQMKAKSITNG
jgi:dTDP-4-dehydrorhamnose reductase